MTNEEKNLIDWIEWNITSLKSSEIKDFLTLLRKNFTIKYKGDIVELHNKSQNS